MPGVDNRIETVRHIRVLHPQFNHAISRIEYCMEKRNSGAGEKYNVRITGGSGTGKSTIRKYFQERYPRVEGPEGITQPIAQFELGSDHRGDFAKDLVDSIHDPRLQKLPSIRDKIKGFKTQAGNIGLLALFIDEFHVLVEKRNLSFVKNVAIDIRTIINSSNICVILLGLPHMNTVFKEKQTYRRFIEEVELKPFDWRNSSDQVSLLKFISLIDEALPFDVISGLSSPEIGFQLYQASSGVIDYFINIVKEAAEDAIRRGDPSIGLDHLSRAYELFVGKRHPFASLRGWAEYNPFVPGHNEINRIVPAGALTEEDE